MPAEHAQPMTVEKALEMTDFWTGGLIFAPGMEGWRIVCATLAAEVRRLRAADVRDGTESGNGNTGAGVP